MCNYIHEEHKLPRRKNGAGWKIFKKDPGSGEFNLGLVAGAHIYRADDYGIIKWSSSSLWRNHERDAEAGFCFFFNKKEAEKVLRLWIIQTPGRSDNIKIRRIQYRNAFCRQSEPSFVMHYRPEIGLCKEFNFLTRTNQE